MNGFVGEVDTQYHRKQVERTELSCLFLRKFQEWDMSENSCRRIRLSFYVPAEFLGIIYLGGECEHRIKSIRILVT